MKPSNLHAPRRPDGAFTIVEMLVSTALSCLVLGAMIMLSVWVYRETSHAQHVSWSQQQAMRSSREIVSYLRNATAVVAIDSQNWSWVEVRMTNGSLSWLTYSAPSPSLRNGTLCLSNSLTHANVPIVNTGVTKIMNTGFSPPIFQLIGSNLLQICYRVVEPVPADPGEYKDQTIGAQVNTSVFLRNYAHN